MFLRQIFNQSILIAQANLLLESLKVPNITALHCAALKLFGLHRTAIHCSWLHCITQHYTVVNCLELHCTTLYCTSLFPLVCTVFYALRALSEVHCTAVAEMENHTTEEQLSYKLSLAWVTLSPILSCFLLKNVHCCAFLGICLQNQFNRKARPSLSYFGWLDTTVTCSIPFFLDTL